MTKYTNVDAVKQVAISLLYTEPKQDSVYSFVVHHPFISISNTSFNNIVYDVKDRNQFLAFCRETEEMFLKKDFHISHINTFIQKSYLLTFFKYANKHYSEIDYARYLKNAWITSENPNDDVNCPIPYIIQWFRKANKRYLMNEYEYNFYRNIPRTLTVYRGVSPGRNPEGISWTFSLKTADFFAKRFATKDKPGYILMAKVKKEEILACFLSRGECEIIVNPSKKKVKKVLDTYGNDKKAYRRQFKKNKVQKKRLKI